MTISTVVFDLGGVLIDWNPRYLYRDLFEADTTAMEHFLTMICTQSWNEEQDAGRSFAEGTAILKREYPEKSKFIDAWFPGFDKMMAGTIEKTVDILAQLRAKNIPLYALTNFSAETFPIAERRFDFLTWFNGIVVSGYEKLAKPDPRIFEILLKRYELIPADTLYIDDNALNIATAQTLGFNTIHFTAPESLADELRSLHLLPLQRYAQ